MSYRLNGDRCGSWPDLYRLEYQPAASKPGSKIAASPTPASTPNKPTTPAMPSATNSAPTNQLLTSVPSSGASMTGRPTDG